ncbi:hypothetical protein [Actinomyces minihominis]|uniref:hypothetical protein n=1 Tax=Actinomyces minihominis TaxID=2002838 RepID=UPI000C06AFD4|nr:hypothetical protein [Actinomyces minihominis]
MDRSEKKRLRAKIGEHLDVSRARLTDDEAGFLSDFIDDYDQYRGTSETESDSYTGWSSDGKYTRKTTQTTTFTDDPGIEIASSYRDDDGQTGESRKHIQDARGVLDWFRENRR